MTVLELEKESRLERKDIHDISSYIFSTMHDIAMDEKMMVAFDNFFDSTTDILEKKLVTDSSTSKKEKLEIIHLLTKLKANKQYIHLAKGNIADTKAALSNLQTAAERMFKKSQSAFEKD